MTEVVLNTLPANNMNFIQICISWMTMSNFAVHFCYSAFQDQDKRIQLFYVLYCYIVIYCYICIVIYLYNYFCREWKREEAEFSKLRPDFLAALDIEKARELKDKGNQKFKENKFDEAVQLYTEALEITPPALRAAEAKDGSRWWVGCVNPFTPKSDQLQISPAASPEILHHTVWRTWVFIAYSDKRWLCYQFSLPHSYISLEEDWRMYFLSLGVKGL